MAQLDSVIFLRNSLLPYELKNPAGTKSVRKVPKMPARERVVSLPPGVPGAQEIAADETAAGVAAGVAWVEAAAAKRRFLLKLMKDVLQEEYDDKSSVRHCMRKEE